MAIIIFADNASAQEKKFSKIERDSTAFFKGVAISMDIVGPMMMKLGGYGQYEGAVRINLKDKYFPIIELGYGKADETDGATDIRYKTQAPYFRIGMDFNLLKKKHTGNRLFAGFRYAHTSYKDDISKTEFSDPVWGYPVNYSYNGNKCYYHWIEAVAGVDAKISGPFHLGWSVRYRKRIAHNEGVIGKSWYVPGFGKSDNSNLGGTFNIIIDI